MIYLDHNATAPVCDASRDAMARTVSLVGNPSSVHGAGRVAGSLLDQARSTIQIGLDAQGATVVFTSGGTEANNLAVLGCCRHVLASAVEHDSVLGPAKVAPNGHAIVPVDRNGIVDLAKLQHCLEKQTGPALVSLMLANNETGAIQPVREAADLVHAHAGLLHCDAVQGPGKIEVSMRALNVDLMTVSAHKFGGPMGAGALLVAAGVDLSPRQIGGAQEGWRRAGTPNLPGIAGFAAALESASPMPHETACLRDQLEERCAALGGLVHGKGVKRLPNTTCLSMKGVRTETQLIAFDLDGIAVSAGAACSSGKVEASHVLTAMGIDPEVASSAIRISLGRMTTQEDIDAFVASWSSLCRRNASAFVE